MTPAPLSKEAIEDLCKRYTMFDWVAQDSINPLAVERAEGCQFFTADGKRYLDFISQFWSVNAGHGNRKIIEAIRTQTEKLCYVNPFFAHEPRARLGEKLAQILPGDINKVFFTLGGAEANEHAVKIARMVTGRHKVLARYRSYHGATMGAITLTGDSRRWAAEPGLPGVVRAPDFHKWANKDPETAETALRELEQVIMFEGGHTIAAFILEPVVGANGVLIPPGGYMEGVRDLCDRHGILLIADEVMTGFGRTGAWFAVNHWNVVPDLITFSKGLTSSYVPLGGVGLREQVASFFDRNVFSSGLTFNSHPVGCAAALAAIEVYEEEGMIENARRMGALLKEELQAIAARHISVGAVRAIGLFAVVELVRKHDPYTPLTPYGGTSEEMALLRDTLLEQGLYTFLRWNMIPISPPLCITEKELREGLEKIDRALSLVDRRLEKS